MDLTTFFNQLWNCFNNRVDENVDNLRDAMESLNGKRLHIEMEMGSSSVSGRKVQYWLQQVAAVKDEVSKIQERIAERSGGCLPMGNCFFAFALPWTATRVIDETHAKVKRLIFEHAFLGPRIIYTLRRSDETIMRSDLNLDKLRSYLIDIDDNVGIIGIWGIGGVGKTTLLRMLNDSMIGGGNLDFDIVVYAEVSRGFNEDFDIDSLKEKNFLLLLDDVHEELDVRRMGIPHPHDLTPESSLKRKIVFTTRSEQICNEMGAERMLEVKCLEPEVARSLFKHGLCEQHSICYQKMVDNNPCMENVLLEVVKECCGLPLAIESMVGQWNESTYLSPVLQGLRTHPLGILADEATSKLSGFDRHTILDDDATTKCLMLCSLWIQCKHIPRDQLIQCIMGHGLMGSFNDFNGAVADAHNIISRLTVGSYLDSTRTSVATVKMHNFLRSVLSLKAASNKWLDLQGNRWIVKAGAGLEGAQLDEWDTARVVAMVDNGIKTLPQRPLPYCRTFIFQQSHSLRGSGSSFEIPPGFFLQMPALTYLDLSKCNLRSLPPDIDLLVQLQYLNLSYTKITSLPGELGGMRELKYLILNSMSRYFAITAEVIESLVNLRVLHMDK